MKKITFLSLFTFIAFIANATVFYVVPGGAGEKDGTTWENAADLTTATLALGEGGDEFWVKAGVYSNTIFIEEGRQVYGGFDGTETELTQRDWAANQTILQGAANATASLVDMKESSLMDGFIIQDNQKAATAGNGGGVTMKFKTTLRNCIVRNNSVIGDNVGGGVFVTNTIKDEIVPTIENCLIYNNSCANNGAGIQVAANCYLHLIGSTIVNNQITKKTGTIGSGYGCGVGLPATATLIAENSIVFNNGKPDAEGTGTLYFSFGANYNMANNPNATVRNCAFDAINAGDGSKESVVFAEETNCINDLSDTKLPGFAKAVTFIGSISVDLADEYEELKGADYRLAVGSICIDNGNNAYATQEKDLDYNSRIQNSIVDLGAYEYVPAPITGLDNPSTTFDCYIADNLLILSGLNMGDDVSVYNMTGKMVFSAKASNNMIQLSLPTKGVYIVKQNSHTQKIIF